MFKTVGLLPVGAASLADDVDASFRQAWDTFHQATVGDYVIWGDRKSALEVVDVEEVAERVVTVLGSGGAEYKLVADVNPDGSPHISPRNRSLNATDLRSATGEEIHDYLEQQDDHPDLDKLSSAQPDELRGGADEENQAEELAEDDATPGVDAGETGSQAPESVGDLRREGPPEGMDWDDFALEGANAPALPPEPVGGDDYVAGLSSEPSMDWDEFQKQSGVPESAKNKNIVQRVLNRSEPTWTFIDELLLIDLDVPKTVNNWHLIDYGIVSDANVDHSRQAAWYNLDTDALVLLGAIKEEDGDDTQFFVYHVEDADEYEGGAEPVFDADDAEDAMAKVRDILYSRFNDDTAEISIEEDPSTGDVTVYDALSSMSLVRAMARARSADPFGLRSYANETTVPEFIQDIDSGIVALYERIRSAGPAGADAWADFVRGARLPTRERIQAYIANVDVEKLGNDARGLVVSAAQGVREKFTGVTVSPAVEYDELGIDLQYTYTSEERDEAGEQVRYGVPARRTITVETEDGPKEVEKGALVSRVLTKVGLEYADLMEAAEWAQLNNWNFHIPDPYQNGKVDFWVGDPGLPPDEQRQRRGRSRSRSRSSSDDGDITRAPSLERWREWDAERLRELMQRYEDDQEKQLYLLYLAHMEPALEEFDDRDDIDDSDFNYRMGNARIEYRDVYGDFDWENDDLEFEVFYDAMNDYYEKTDSIPDALDEAITNRYGNVDTSRDFDNLAFSTGGAAQEADTDDDSDQPLPVGVGEPADDDDDDGQDGGSDLTPRLRTWAQAFADHIEEGEENIEELGQEERKFLAIAHDEMDLLSGETAAKLSRIRGGHYEGEVTTADESIGDMMKWNKTANMDGEERIENAEDMVNPGERERSFENRD